MQRVRSVLNTGSEDGAAGRRTGAGSRGHAGKRCLPAHILLDQPVQLGPVALRPVEAVDGKAMQRALQVASALVVAVLEDGGPGEGQRVVLPMGLGP